MATSADLSPSEEKAFYMRMQALLVEGGTLVLRHLFDSKRPASQWNAFLNQANIRIQATQLRNKKVITDVQYKLLYPQIGVTDPSKYDVALIVCLLRSFCGLNSKAAVWNGYPPSSDQSEEADIRRLHIERNTLAHGTSALITRQMFETQWPYIEEVLLRLGRNIPDLKQNIDNLKTKSIDPEREQYLLDVIREWEEMDASLQTDINEMKSQVEEHDKSIHTLKQENMELNSQTGHLEKITNELSGRIGEHEDDSKRQENRIKTQELEVQSIADKLEKSESGHNELEAKVAGINETLTGHERRFTDVESSARDTNEEISRLTDAQATIEQATKMSGVLKNLSDITELFLTDSLSDDVYVRTRLHGEAKEKLETNNIVVLSGHPGEGKTTMATKLVLEVTTIDRCLKLAQPSDWRHVDFELFDTIFIDDIFGPGVLDESLVKGWDKCLPEIWKAIQKKRIKVVITTRHYILKEAKQKFNRPAVFHDNHIQLLSSKELSTDERRQMLKAHLNINDKRMAHDAIEQSVSIATSFLDSLLGQEPSFLFGFPECVSMFVQNEELLNRGPEFFSKPNQFFRDCLDGLKRDEEKFLALLIIWTRQDKKLYQNDLDLSSMSEEISQVSKMFGYKLKGKLLKTLRNSLKHHTDGFLRYSPSTGAYRFSHNVISDMVGLVISEDYPEACLKCTDKDFLQYITIKSSEEGRFRFFVEEHLHDKLMQTIIRLAEKPPETLSSLADLLLLQRGGRRPNTVQFSELDASVFVHDVFSDKIFVRKFVIYLRQLQQMDRILTKPVMKMSGFFLSYGFQLEEMDIYLPAYSLFHSKGLLLLELTEQKVIPHGFDEERHKNELYLALLIAAHENHIDVAKALVNSKVEVSEEAIYVAAMNQHLEILQCLLENSERHATSRCKFENNNNAVMVASKKGLTESVRLLARYKDLSPRNDANVSALDKAIVFNWSEITQILIDYGAPINEKGGKFKRTPLHTAADMGHSTIVEQLLKAGANTRIKDHRGHFAIHCAAIFNYSKDRSLARIPADLDDPMQNVAEDCGDAIQSHTEDCGDAIQSHTEDCLDAIQSHTEDCGDAIQSHTEDCGDAIQSHTEDCGDAIQSHTEDCGDAIQSHTEDCGNAIQSHTEDCGDAIQSNTEDCDAIQSHTEDCGDAIQSHTEDCDDAIQSHTEDCDAIQNHTEDCTTRQDHTADECVAKQNKTEVVKILALHDPTLVKLRIGSYGKASKIKGMTVFHVALWKNDLDLLKVLLNIRSQDCNVQDWFGRTPLYQASYDGSVEFVKLLLPHADVNKPEKQGYTPLHAAIFKGHEEIIRLLLPHSNVNARDKHGRTPLHSAFREGYCDIVRELLQRGADPNMKTKRGLNVYQVRRNRKRPSLFELLGVPFGNKPGKPNVNFNECFSIIHEHSPLLLLHMN